MPDEAVPVAATATAAAVPATMPEYEPPARPRALSLFEMAAAPEEIAAGVQQFRKVAAAVLLPSDIAPISGHPFIRKSGWQRLAMTFGVHTEVASVQRHPGTAAEGGAWRVTMRAVKGHCSVERSGLCTLAERQNKGKQGSEESTAMAMAETRAVGRAVSALFGLGEVTAEEAAGMRPEDMQAIVTPGAEAAYAAQAEARGMQPEPAPASSSQPSPAPPPPKPMPSAEVETLKQSRIAELKKLGVPDADIPANMLGISTLLEQKRKAAAAASEKKPQSDSPPPEAPPNRPGPVTKDAPAESPPRKEADADEADGAQEGAPSVVASGAPPDGPAPDEGDGETSSPDQNAEGDCTCSDDSDVLPAPLPGSGDLSAWMCLACGGAFDDLAARLVLARMRDQYAALRTSASLTHEQTTEQLAYPAVPQGPDLAKPPTAKQLELLDKLNATDKAPPATQAHAWARAAGILRGKA